MNEGTVTESSLSFGQEQMFIYECLMPRSLLYNVSYRISFPYKISSVLLKTAIQTIVARHEILRTTFVVIDGKPVQRIHSEMSVHLEITDATEVKEEAKDYYRPKAFDIENGPLMRAHLVLRDMPESVLWIDFHHLIYDGGSADIFANELSKIYIALCCGHTVLLPPIYIQYADYTQWQRKRYDEGGCIRDIEYWKKTLSMVPPLMSLPTDFPRKKVPTFRGAKENIVLSSDVVHRLVEISKDTNISLFTILTTSVNVLLSLYSGQDDICVGFPVDQRSRAGLDGSIGFFANMVVLRTKLSLESTFLTLLDQTNDAIFEAIDHSEVPFGKLVEELRPERSTSQNPFFQVCVADHSIEREWRLGDEPASSVEYLEQNVAKFDITFYFICDAEKIAIDLEYSTDLFLPKTAKLISEKLSLVVEVLSETPSEAIYNKSFVSKAEFDCLLLNSRGKQSNNQEIDLIDAFRKHVRLTPDAIAVSCGSSEITYRELDVRSDTLGRAFKFSPDQMEPRVGIFCTNTINQAIAILAILKSGGCYVPLDLSYPQLRIQKIILDTNMSVVVGETIDFHKISEICPLEDIYLVENFSTEDAGCEAYNGTHTKHKDRLACIIYTSGSTGTPKGVAVSIHSIARLVVGNTYLPFDASQVYAQISNFCFDAYTFELWAALLHGARLVSPESRLDLEPNRFSQFVVEHRITSLFITSALLSQFAEAGFNAFHGVKYLMFGGDKAESDILVKLRHLGFQGELINGYGPTEATTFACVYKVSDQELVCHTVPIGRPIVGVEAYILTPTMAMCPVGVPGELYIGGDCLARGYWGQPAATAEVFVPHPFSKVPGSRLYKSGDLCYWADGDKIIYISRLDRQVKINGYRIELDEVRRALIGVEGVSNAVVHVESLQGGIKKLIAYVVPQNQADNISVGAVRSELVKLLPTYSIPNTIYIVATLPLTQNGKLDSRALVALRDAAPVSALTDTVVVSDLELTLFSIVEQTLGVSHISGGDRFFELGGTSIDAIRIAGLCRVRLNRQVPLSIVLSNDTLSETALNIAAIPVVCIQALMPLALASDSRKSKLSYSQESLYFLFKLRPASLVYDVPYLIHLDGPIDPVALDSAFQSIISRHTSLRTRFIDEDDGPVQVVLPNPNFSLTVTDCSIEAGGDSLVELAKARFLDSPFDLCSGENLRAELLSYTTDRHILLIKLPHIIFDGRSEAILSQELSWYYKSYLGQPSIVDMAPSVPYIEYVNWQRRSFEQGDMANDLKYWKEVLADAPYVLNLPTYAGRPAIPSYKGRREEKVLDHAALRSIVDFSQKNGVTPFVIFSAALAITLAHFSNQNDVLIGFPASGRSREGLEQTIGFFSNMVVQRVCLSADSTYLDIVKYCREQVLFAIEHGAAPFEKILDVVRPPRTLSVHPIFQVAITVQEPGLRWHLGPTIGYSTAFESDTSKYDMSFNFQILEGGINIAIEFATDLFLPEVVMDISNFLENCLKKICVDPSSKIYSFDNVSVASPSRIIRLRNL